MSPHADYGHRKSSTPSFLSSVYKTPILPPPEELKLLQLWERLLDYFDREEPRGDGTELKKVTSSSSSNSSECSDPGSNPPTSSSDRRSSIVSKLRQDRGLDKPMAANGKSRLNPPYRMRMPGRSNSSFFRRTEDQSAGDYPHRQQTPREALWSMLKDEHPDELLSRHLVNSKWDVDAAFASIVATMKWRGQTRRVHQIVFEGEHGAHQTLKTSKDKRELKVAQGFLRLLKVGTSFCRGLDWQGRPVLVQRACVMHSNTQPLESVRRFIIWHSEVLRLVMPPSVVSFVTIYDMTDASASNLDVGAARFLVDTLQKYYPQGIAQVIIHRAPKIFFGFWSIVKKALTPESVAKIAFTWTVNDLEKLIPREHIPWWMGGDDNFDYSYPEPTTNEDWLMNNSEARSKLLDERAKASIRFDDATRELIDATRHGNPDIEDIKNRRIECVEEARKFFWMLDPFVRSRTIYDRWGMIDPRRNVALQGDMDAPCTDKLLKKLYTEAGVDLDPKRYGEPNLFWQSREHLGSS